MGIPLETKAHYYERLLKMMVTPPKMSDDIHGVYSPGVIRRTTRRDKPEIDLLWEILPNRMWYHLGVIPWYDDKILLAGQLHFKKTPEVQAWVNRKRDPNIFDMGDHYEWKRTFDEYPDFFNDVSLQYPNREIPRGLLNQAAFTVRERFASFCRGSGSNPYFDLYFMLQ